MPIMYINPARKAKKITKKKTAKKKAASTKGKRATKKNPARKRKPTKRINMARKSKKRAVRLRSARRNSAKRIIRRKRARRNPWSEPKKKITVTRMVALGHREAALAGWAKKKSKKRKPAKKAASKKRAVTFSKKRKAVSKKRKSVSKKRKGRSNPAEAISLIKSTVLPIAASLYAARIVSGKVATKIPGIDKIPANFRSPAIAAGLLAAGFFATKKVGALRKYKEGILTGLGLNLVDKLVGAFAPASVQEMVGVSAGMGEFVQIGEYMQIGDVQPIDDQITLSDYVQVGDFYQDLGAEEDLGGVYQDLGALPGAGNAWGQDKLGGVARNSLAAPVKKVDYMAPVPVRSFTKEIPEAGDDYDSADNLYTGMFSGGFGN